MPNSPAAEVGAAVIALPALAGCGNEERIIPWFLLSRYASSTAAFFPWNAAGTPPTTPDQTELLLLCVAGSAGPLGGRPLRQSRNNLNARPKRSDRLLDHQSLLRPVRHNPLDHHERGEAEDRVPPGVGHHYVIPAWQSFIPGNIEKELYETLEQRLANVVDILPSADTVAVLGTEEDVTELLWVGGAELNEAA